MPSEKLNPVQWLREIWHNGDITTEDFDKAEKALTAAEQAEPAIDYLEAFAAQSRKLQAVLRIPGVKERLSEMNEDVEQAEPAPAARSGAVKVKALMCDFEDFINQPPQYEDQRMVRDYRHELYRKWEPLCRLILTAALEPAEPEVMCVGCEGKPSLGNSPCAVCGKQAAEPAADAEPVAWSYEMANYIDNDGSYTGWVGPRLSFQKPNTPEGAVRNVIPLFTRQTESQLRELIATLIPHLNLTSPGAIDVMKEALRALGGPDAVR